jgi:hypothetical protein
MAYHDSKSRGNASTLTHLLVCSYKRSGRQMPDTGLKTQCIMYHDKDWKKLLRFKLYFVSSDQHHCVASKMMMMKMIVIIGVRY